MLGSINPTAVKEQAGNEDARLPKYTTRPVWTQIRLLTHI